MSGKKSAKEAIPGGAIGVLVGVGGAYAARRYGVALPPEALDAISTLIVGVASSIGAVASSFILGNRRRG